MDKKVCTLIIWFLLIIIMASCEGNSSTNDNQGMEKIIEKAMPKMSQPNSLFSIENFKEVKFKPLREYKNVEELDGLEASWYGNFAKSDYEIRFYESYEAAKTLGVKDAGLVTGESGLVTGDNVPWSEGAKDRRRCSRPPHQPHSGCNYTSKYGDFIVIGNVIMMCEGKDILESREVCNKLAELLK